MSGRGVWIIALGAALAALFALNLLRSQVPGSADAGVASSRVGSDQQRENGLAAQRAAEEIRVSPSRDPREGATDGRGAPTEPQPAPVLPPGAVPYASISAALEEHDVPPERRMRPIPEMLETERVFAAESVDPGWSTAVEASVLARFAEMPGLSLVSLNVECRATLCLLQFVTPQTPAPDYPNPNVAEIAQSAGLKSLWMFGIRAAGAPVTLAYLERREPAEAVPADAATTP